MKHVVMYSGGAGSFLAAFRVVSRYGQKDTTLLTADTRSEADDWYDFLRESAEFLRLEPIIVKHGMDIWQLARKNRAIPNTRMPFCSRILKRELLDLWLDDHCTPNQTMIYLGLDWTEDHRLVAAQNRLNPWHVRTPLVWDPMMDKPDIVKWVSDIGLTLPEAYVRGMPHNNCLKYGCVKGGVRYWKQLLREFPESFARSEEAEQGIRDLTGKDVSILRDRTGGTTKPFPLSELRRRTEKQPSLFDESLDWGACACY